MERVYPPLTALRVPDAQVSGSLSSSFDGLGLYSLLHVCLSAIWCAGTRKELTRSCVFSLSYMKENPTDGPLKQTPSL